MSAYHTRRYTRQGLLPSGYCLLPSAY